MDDIGYTSKKSLSQVLYRKPVDSHRQFDNGMYYVYIRFHSLHATLDVKPAVSWRNSNYPCWISERHAWYHSSIAGIRHRSQMFTNNISDESFRHMQEQPNSIRDHQQIQRCGNKNEFNKKTSYNSDCGIWTFLPFFRYMAALEDTTNLSVCGVLYIFSH